MRSEGAELLYGLESLAVTGFWEVVKHLLRFRRIYHDVIARTERERPDVVIFVDYPGMNLRLARELKRRGYRIVYYIVPQVWAWKPGRIRQIEERVDLLLSILPFEKTHFNPDRIKCEFVGHPLLDLISSGPTPAAFREKHLTPPANIIVGLLPGSRIVEITRHYRLMLEAVKLLQREGFAVQPLTAVRDEIDPSIYLRTEEQVGVHPVPITHNRYDLLKSADVSLVASGTATLEAALCGRPFCVVYKTGWISYQIARRLISLKMVGLVNIVAGERLVPEYLQQELTVDNLSAFCRRMLTDPAATELMIAKLATVRDKLGQPGAAARAAALIADEFLP